MKNTDKKSFAPEAAHEKLLRESAHELSFDSMADFTEWRDSVRKKLRELLGMPRFQRVKPNLRIEYEKECGDFHETRFIFTAEPGADVPCHLLKPLNCKKAVPVIICLQGHSTGMHISLARTKYEGDEELISGGDRDFAIQTVKQGYAALVIEQRAFGERADQRPPERHPFHAGCTHASMVELLLGRTMIGARCWDVMRAIDLLASFPGIDNERIACMGNSGGGTITYFLSCLEPRVRVAMPSCYVCDLSESIARIDHCVDNYVPGMLEHFELADLACLIAPRPLLVVAGEQDDIFPIAGVKSAFKRIQQIYRKAGAAANTALVIGPGGHRFYADQAWPKFKSLSGWQ